MSTLQPTLYVRASSKRIPIVRRFVIAGLFPELYPLDATQKYRFLFMPSACQES